MWLFTALSIIATFFWQGNFVPAVKAEWTTSRPAASRLFGPPVELKIPVIGLDTPVIQVGLNEKKLVDVPSQLAGWYRGGVIPGETGNSTIQGHVTAVFRNIDKLNVGDMLLVKDGEGKVREFMVLEKELVETQKFNVQKVYGATNNKRLNLITCAGRFDIQTKDFDQRMIIYSELVAE